MQESLTTRNHTRSDLAVLHLHSLSNLPFSDCIDTRDRTDLRKRPPPSPAQKHSLTALTLPNHKPGNPAFKINVPTTASSRLKRRLSPTTLAAIVLRASKKPPHYTRPSIQTIHPNHPQCQPPSPPPSSPKSPPSPQPTTASTSRTMSQSTTPVTPSSVSNGSAA